MSDEQRRQAIRKMAKELTEKLSRDGLIIEGGWRGFEVLFLQQASELQQVEMRKAFFAGAQHLFSSIMQILDPSTEPTEKDLHRMDSIHRELERFTLELKPRG